jgi:glycerol-3-phosphate dehydrogenase (NAD(P)+)
MARNTHIAVLGAGAWGTALATLAARNAAKVHLWARDPAHAVEMAATGVNTRRLPGVPLPDNLVPTAALADVAAAEIVLLAVPAQAVRATCQALAAHIARNVPLVICAKGIERTSGLFLSEVVADVLPENPPAVLSGPSFAEDVAKGLPTAVTLAARRETEAAELARMLAAPWFRLYHSRDIRGVEIGGAAKNVLAIASGIAAGRGLGASAGAALIARGFAELSRFGHAYGTEVATLAGLSGLGDLVLTCTSSQSRNFSFGVALGRGTDIAAARAEGHTTEGVFTAGVLVDLAHRKTIDMPICEAVEAVLAERIGIDAAIEALLARPLKSELMPAHSNAG